MFVTLSFQCFWCPLPLEEEEETPTGPLPALCSVVPVSILKHVKEITDSLNSLVRPINKCINLISPNTSWADG